MKSTNNNIRVITIIGVIVSLIGYFYLLYKSYSLNQDISSKHKDIVELAKKKERLTEEIKELELYNTKQDSIISASHDINTRNQGIELKKEMGEPIGDYFVITNASNRSLNNAQKYEEEGFQFLVDKNVESAIISFKKSENSYNSYHQVYEIGRFLSKNKNKLTDKKSEFWIFTYKTILAEYSYKMPIQYKKKLEELSK